MISYHPAMDRYHTIFRMVCLLGGLAEDYPMETDKFRILDFYMAFPFRLQDFTFKPTHSGHKKVGKAYEHARPYGGVPDDASLFLRMTPMQVLAMDTLAAHDIIDREMHKRDAVLPGDETVPIALLKRAVEFKANNDALLSALRKLAREYPLLGNDGLKRRSGLMEFKYDAI